MSSILLSNPFPAQPAPSAMTAEPPATAAITPVLAGGTTGSSDSAASFTGSGAGSSRQAENVALFQSADKAKWTPPAKATGGSVINAQARANTDRDSGIELPLGPDLPAVEMPDPLPTSPFLKPNNDVA